MFTLVTRGLRDRWSLESCLCDSSPATKQRCCSDRHRCRYRCSVTKGIVAFAVKQDESRRPDDQIKFRTFSDDQRCHSGILIAAACQTQRDPYPGRCNVTDRCHSRCAGLSTQQIQPAGMIPGCRGTLVLLACTLSQSVFTTNDKHDFESWLPADIMRSHDIKIIICSHICRLPCSCPWIPAQCPPGSSLIVDGCGCCKICARRIGEPCDQINLCDQRQELTCDYSTSIDGRGGTCNYNQDDSCKVDGKVYEDGETFQPSCKVQCTCVDGGVTCIPLCSEDIRLPSPTCPFPIRVNVPGKCCHEWICNGPQQPKLLNSVELGN
ncbi:unnamed protein product [Ranitomeya imitator]|uniref:WNT1-inducible-signaling pathway protein 2 n=1 Tax=Ranitomeya imitator TaxID=111125 RepID=A0ABN9KXL0_9NEOB|nr:unnamed protein product [Ranitomeya imitator]